MKNAEKTESTSPTFELVFDRGTVVVVDAHGRDLAPAWPGGLKWDPRTRQFRLPAWRWGGLKDWLETHAIPFEYRSGRPAGFAPEPGRAPPALRSYQRAALEAWVRQGRRGCIELPTGAGKTRLAMACLLSLGCPTLIAVPTCHLLHQWKETLREFYPGPVALFGDGSQEVQPITLITFESAYRHLDRFGGHFDFLIVDEAHHLTEKCLQEIPVLTTAESRLGLSATFPIQVDQRAFIENLLGPKCFSISIAKLVGKFLAPFEIKILPLRLTREEYLEYDHFRNIFYGVYLPFTRNHPQARWEDFARACSRTATGREALAAMRQSQEIIAMPKAKLDALDYLLGEHAGDPTLIFTSSNRVAYAISRRFLIPAITCAIGRDERQKILRHFDAGRYRAIVSTKVLNEGLDAPTAVCGIIAGGSSSQREHLQRLGRILRPRPGKKAILYELVIMATADWSASEARNQSHVFRTTASL